MYIAQKYGVVIILKRVTDDEEILSSALLESDFVFSRGRRLCWPCSSRLVSRRDYNNPTVDPYKKKKRKLKKEKKSEKERKFIIRKSRKKRGLKKKKNVGRQRGEIERWKEEDFFTSREITRRTYLKQPTHPLFRPVTDVSQRKEFFGAFFRERFLYREVDREARPTIADHANNTHTGCLSHSKKEPGSQRIERDLRFFTVNWRNMSYGGGSVYIGCQITLNGLLLEISIFEAFANNFLNLQSKFAQPQKGNTYIEHCLLWPCNEYIYIYREGNFSRSWCFPSVDESRKELGKTWKFTNPGSPAIIESIGDRLAKVQMYIGT